MGLARGRTEVWDDMHQELAALSKLGRQVHVACGHEMPFSSPDDVLGAIDAVLEQASHAHP